MNVLTKPYTEEQRINFILEQNHRLGYEIHETETALVAGGYTEEEKETQKKAIKQDIKIFIYKILISVLYVFVIIVGMLLANINWEVISKNEDLVFIVPVFIIMFGLPLIIYLDWDSYKRC